VRSLSDQIDRSVECMFLFLFLFLFLFCFTYYSLSPFFRLQACLSWYCCSKFSPRDMGHIDTTPWTDATAELDPRIFQGHVWHSGKVTL
jgi:hypothetical protein